MGTSLDPALAAGPPSQDDDPNFFDPRTDLPDMEHYALFKTLEGHNAAVAEVSFAHDGSLLASAGADGTARIWDTPTGEEVRSLPHSEGTGVNSVAWSTTSHAQLLVATGADDFTVCIWDPRQLSPAMRLLRVLDGHTNYVTAVRFSKSGNWLATASYDETIRIWCTHTGKLIRQIPAHSDPVMSIDISQDETKPMILSTSLDGTVRLWNATTGECVNTLLIPSAAARPPSGAMEPAKGQGRHAASDLPPPGTAVCFTPNSVFGLVSCLDSRMRLWDFQSQEAGGKSVLVRKTYLAHRNERHQISNAFLVNEPSNNKYVVSGSEDHHVYLWDLNKREVRGLLRGRATKDSPGTGHCDVVLGVATSPTQPILATSGGKRDGTVKIWKYDGL